MSPTMSASLREGLRAYEINLGIVDRVDLRIRAERFGYGRTTADVCQTRIAENAQIERDTDFAVRMLRDEQSNFDNTWRKYIDNIKKQPNYCANQKTYDLLVQTIMTAMYCKDPDDVKILTNQETLKPGKVWASFIDEWMVNTIDCLWGH